MEERFIGKKVKFNNKLFNIKVLSYYDGRMRLKYYNKSESHDLTMDLKDSYIEDDKVF